MKIHRQSASSAGAVSIRWRASRNPRSIASKRRLAIPPTRSSPGKCMDGRFTFLPRHGRGHRLLPHELNHRANIYALRSLNVRWIICVTAVGSLQEKYAPRDVRLALAVFRSNKPARRAHIFRRRHCRARELRGTDLNQFAPHSRGVGSRVGRKGPQRRNVREHGWPGLFHPRRIGVESPARLRRHWNDQSCPRQNWREKRRSLLRPWR